MTSKDFYLELDWGKIDKDTKFDIWWKDQHSLNVDNYHSNQYKNSNILEEVRNFSDELKDLKGVEMVGRMDGDKTVEITHFFHFSDFNFNSLFQFMYVWSEVYKDHEDLSGKDERISPFMKEGHMMRILNKTIREYFNDPSNKKILDRVDNDNRGFTWCYRNKEMNNLNWKLIPQWKYVIE